MSFFFQAEDGIRDTSVTGVQTCALPISDQLSGLGDGGVPLRPVVGIEDGRLLLGPRKLVLHEFPPLGAAQRRQIAGGFPAGGDRKSTRLNSSHRCISYAVFCLKKKNTTE